MKNLVSNDPKYNKEFQGTIPKMGHDYNYKNPSKNVRYDILLSERKFRKQEFLS